MQSDTDPGDTLYDRRNRTNDQQYEEGRGDVKGCKEELEEAGHRKQKYRSVPVRVHMLT